ncbi:uncharacterized protein SOCE836_026110 [Sorangium cellulosum]|uniref:Transposase n=1 Tax=Sorangium cellulosum TaxID=56 RepID=A0A4P2QKQ2_SORCE|nr:uncharacterized protein SOCE836_026110 [Sorangium cellulosum]
MGRRKRRAFTPEFKAEAVRLAKASDRSIGQVAKDLDLTETALRDWIKRSRSAERVPKRACGRRPRAYSRGAMTKRRSGDAGVEVPSLTTAVLKLSAPQVAWQGREDAPARAKGRPRRAAEQEEERAGAAEAAGVRRRKTAAQPSAEEVGERRPTRGADKQRRSEANRRRPVETSSTVAGRSDDSTGSTSRRTSARTRKGRAPGSAAPDATSTVGATQAGDAARSAVAEDEPRAGDPSQVQVLEPPLGDEALSRRDPVLGTQVEDAAERIARSHGQDLLQVQLGVEPVHLAGRDERRDGTGPDSMLVAAVEEPVASSLDDAAQSPLTGIVVDGDLPVGEELAERLPLVVQIDQPFAQRRMLRDDLPLRLDPGEELLNQRCGLALPDLETLVRAARGAFLLDAEERLDGLERERRILARPGLERLEEAPSCMAPAAGLARLARPEQHVVVGRGIGDERPLVAAEELRDGGTVVRRCIAEQHPIARRDEDEDMPIAVLVLGPDGGARRIHGEPRPRERVAPDGIGDAHRNAATVVLPACHVAAANAEAVALRLHLLPVVWHVVVELVDEQVGQEARIGKASGDRALRQRGDLHRSAAVLRSVRLGRVAYEDAVDEGALLEARVRGDPQELVLPHDEGLVELALEGRLCGWQRSRLLARSAARRRCLRLGHVLGATPDDLHGAAAPVADHRAVFDAHTLEALATLEQHLRRQRLDDHPRDDTDATAPVLVALNSLATSGIRAGAGLCGPPTLRRAREARRRDAAVAPIRLRRGAVGLGLRRSLSRTGVWLAGQRKPQLVRRDLLGDVAPEPDLQRPNRLLQLLIVRLERLDRASELLGLLLRRRKLGQLRLELLHPPEQRVDHRRGVGGAPLSLSPGLKIAEHERRAVKALCLRRLRELGLTGSCQGAPWMPPPLAPGKYLTQALLAVFDENPLLKMGTRGKHGAPSTPRSREVFGRMQLAPCSISASG